MVSDRSRVGKQMRHGYRFVARKSWLFSEDSSSVKTMIDRRCYQSSFKLCRSALLVGFLVVLFLGAQANAKGFQRNLESFFGTIDQDGNGEIEQGEATKFLRKLDAQMADDGEMEIKEGMSDLIASSQFDFNFSYGGNTISAEEMLDHLSNMMTANHVVDWVTHGLQLPQYAESFRQNAINGMDFPSLIENDSEALLEDLGIKSTLHRTKITHALVRQIFGIGTIPGQVRSLQCHPSRYGGIELSWEAPNNMGVPPLHKYLIERWSKTFSTWTNVADTREVVFLDKNAVKLGKEYTYRVQTWGGHGPSEWVTVGGCTADVTPAFSPIIRSDMDDSPPKQTTSSTDMWTWINSGIILTLALFSRHTFFFDVTLAAWVLLKTHLKHSLRQGLESPHLCVRTVSRSVSLALESWCYMQHKVWALARFGVDPDLAAKRARFGVDPDLAAKRATLKSLSEPCMKSPFEEEVELEGEFFETQNFRSVSAGDLLEAISGGSSPNGSVREIEMADSVPPFFAPASPPLEELPELPELPAVPSKRSKNRCNHEGCKVRFDRWHSLQDWWMKLNKHYCRDCQSVYCVKHTRISPHGPRGQCGLDSSCYCCACFASLPAESKRRLEEMNKLRVGPSVVSSDEASSSSSSSLGSSKQRFGSLSNSSITSAGMPQSLSDSVEPCDDLLDFRDAVETQSGPVSNAASQAL